MTWEKLPAIEGKLGGCVNCGVRPSCFPPDGIISVGFGYAALLKDGEEIYNDDNSREKDSGAFFTGRHAEDLARADPDHNWLIVLEGPLSGRTYQRHGENQWALVEQNRGFA